MPNLLTRNPMEITAAMAASYKSATATSLGTSQTLLIEKVYWENAINLGDYLRIIDPDGGTSLVDIYNVAPGSSYWIDWTSKPKLWRDFRVSQIDSGRLFIFTR